MNRSEARRLRELEREREALRTALERERRDLSDLEERRRELEARHREDLEQIARLSQSIDARCVALDARTMGLWAREIEQEMARHADSELASRVSRAREMVESARREQQAVQVQLNTAEAKLRDIMRRDAHNASAIVRHIEGVLASTGDSELAQMQGSNPIETQKIEAERLHRRLQQLGLEVERRALAADIYAREVVKRRTSKPQAEIQAADSEAATLRAQAAKTERRLNAVEAQIAELQAYRPPPGQAEQPAGTWRLLWLLAGGWYWELWRRRWGSSPASALFAFLSSIVVGVGAMFLIAFAISSRQGEFAPTQISQPALSTRVTRVSDQVVDIQWDGSPRDGLGLSSLLPLRTADRVEITYLGGCLRPRWWGEDKWCGEPWGFLDVLYENEPLFRWKQGAFAVHIVQGDTGSPTFRQPWERGASRMVVIVRRLPVLLYYNTIVNSGVLYGDREGPKVVDGYAAPGGAIQLRVVNRGP